MNHVFRTTPPWLIEGALDEMEKLQRSFFQKSIVGTSLTDLQWEIAQLPLKYGGWGFTPPKLQSQALHLSN